MHQLERPVEGEPMPSGRVGARVVVPLSGTPSPRWSEVLTAHLAHDLTGHCAVGHLRISRLVQGRRLVLEGVEAREAPALGRCLRDAVDAANRACEHDDTACPTNMSADEAEAIASAVEAHFGEVSVAAGSR